MLSSGEAYAATRDPDRSLEALCVEGLPDAATTFRPALAAVVGWRIGAILAGQRHPRSLST